MAATNTDSKNSRARNHPRVWSSEPRSGKNVSRMKLRGKRRAKVSKGIRRGPEGTMGPCEELHRAMTQQQYDGREENARGMKSPGQQSGGDENRIVEKVNAGRRKRGPVSSQQQDR